ncbi:zinc-binding dehydrogenase [Brucella anthropi]|uniref:zinc-binding dehydrogenase n=1 Tax=Brucella anthropi TaxID=529 RepID=UPI00215812E4|nr:zinc-binding dehydrogenase [Brucella anthropi]MCR8493434.1 zinc-binding dehydrogenase [Brucella anthropi]
MRHVNGTKSTSAMRNSASEDRADGAAFVERGADDRHQFRFIVSPEDGTDGLGVDYAIDGIGGDMLSKSLACTRRFGMVASIGQVAGPIPPIAVEDIGPIRSLSFARPSVMAYAADPTIYPQAAAALLEFMRLDITADVGGEYAFTDAPQAQAGLEAGRTTGSLLLLP